VSCSWSHSGSALRLSQPLSGFQANTSSTALFHAATVPGFLPSECFPHENRAPFSGPHAPLQLSTDVQKCTAFGLVIVSFADIHVSQRSSLVPLTTMGSLSAGKPASRSPRTSGGGFTSFRRLRLLRSLSPLVSPFTPSWVAPRQRLILSWVFSPLKPNLLRLDSSDLLRPESPSTRQRSLARSRHDPKATPLTHL
jgi:hypothetical protein